MSRKKLIPVVLVMACAFLLFGCSNEKKGSQNFEEAQIKQENITSEASENDDMDEIDNIDDENYEDEDSPVPIFNLADYNFKNSLEGREYNFLCFQNEETVDGIESLSVTIYNEKDEVLEEFVIQNPGIDDYYCISPILNQGEDVIASYTVEFCVNDTFCWSRHFEADPENSNGPRFNVISIYNDENGIGFESCLAG